MRISGLALPCAALAALAGCGEDGQAARTITETVGAGPTAGAAPPATSAPTGPSGTSGATGAADTAPTAPLPSDTGGTTAVQGRYAMRVSQSDFPLLTTGEELTWGAVTRCEDEFVVELRRENENGGFKNIELQADGTSRYADDGTGQTDRCAGAPGAPTRDRTSLSVTKQRMEATSRWPRRSRASSG